jgi:hypothetical protein
MKILRIERCGGCPHMYFDRTIVEYICTHARDKGLIPETGIPDWCPLPDEAVEEMLEIMEKARRWNEWQQYPNLVALINTFWKILNENEEYKSEVKDVEK